MKLILKRAMAVIRAALAAMQRSGRWAMNKTTGAMDWVQEQASAAVSVVEDAAEDAVKLIQDAGIALRDGAAAVASVPGAILGSFAAAVRGGQGPSAAQTLAAQQAQDAAEHEQAVAGQEQAPAAQPQATAIKLAAAARLEGRAPAGWVLDRLSPESVAYVAALRPDELQAVAKCGLQRLEAVVGGRAGLGLPTPAEVQQREATAANVVPMPRRGVERTRPRALDAEDAPEAQVGYRPSWAA